MVDLETLGTDVDSTIFQIAAVGFDIKTGAIGSEFNKIADISKNASFEMTVSGQTLKWWTSTAEKARMFRNLLDQGEGSSTDLIEDFRRWLQGLNAIGDVHLWGNGILFDNNILRQHMGEEDYPIHYRRDRDVRTIVDLACDKLDVNQFDLMKALYTDDPAHDAMNDALNQVKLVTYCYHVLTKDNDELYRGQKKSREEFEALLKPAVKEDGSDAETV